MAQFYTNTPDQRCGSCVYCKPLTASAKFFRKITDTNTDTDPDTNRQLKLAKLILVEHINFTPITMSRTKHRRGNNSLSILARGGKRGSKAGIYQIWYSVHDWKRPNFMMLSLLHIFVSTNIARFIFQIVSK